MQAGRQAIQHKRMVNKPLEDKKPLLLEGKGLENEPLKEEEP